MGGLAQLARAPALQAGGHRFEPDILHMRTFFDVVACVTREEASFVLTEIRERELEGIELWRVPGGSRAGEPRGSGSGRTGDA